MQREIFIEVYGQVAMEIVEAAGRVSQKAPALIRKVQTFSNLLLILGISMTVFCISATESPGSEIVKELFAWLGALVADLHTPMSFTCFHFDPASLSRLYWGLVGTALGDTIGQTLGTTLTECISSN